MNRTMQAESKSSANRQSRLDFAFANATARSTGLPASLTGPETRLSLREQRTDRITARQAYVVDNGSRCNYGLSAHAGNRVQPRGLELGVDQAGKISLRFRPIQQYKHTNPMQVEVTDSEVIIRLPRINPPKPSSTGKSLLVATTNGNKPTTATVADKPVVVSVNAYISAH